MNLLSFTFVQTLTSTWHKEIGRILSRSDEITGMILKIILILGHIDTPKFKFSKNSLIFLHV